MRLEQLEYLVVISKCRSLSEASKRLFITQQSLGKSIANLEKELGVTLLTRASRGCYLTKEGLEVLDAAKGILHQIDELKSRYNTCNSVAGDLIVLCCPAVHETVLPATIESLSRKMPQMKVTALAKDSFLIPDLHRRLSNCGNETVMSVLNIPDCNTELKNKIDANQEFQPLADDYWVACMSKSHPLATKTNITLKELFKEPLVIEYPDYPEIGIDRVTLSHFEKFGNPNIKKIVDSESLCYLAIENNNYIGFASNFFARNSKNPYSNVAFKEFTPTIYSQIGCLYNKSDTNNEKVQLFLRCLKEQMILRK